MLVGIGGHTDTLWEVREFARNWHFGVLKVGPRN